MAINSLTYRQFYRRRLPHIVPPDATFFVTFRLVNSLPQALLRKYRARKEWLEAETKRLLATGNADAPEVTEHIARMEEFHRTWFQTIEDWLDRAEAEENWLQGEAVARIVTNSLHFLDHQSYDLMAYCVMPNHVHVVFRPLLTAAELTEARDDSGPLYFLSEHPSLARIMKSLKGFTAREANRVLHRQGAFWESESYDHWVRDEADLDRIVTYVLNNPVKAGFVAQWQDWPYSYKKV